MTADPYGRGIGWPFRLGVAGIAESEGVQRVEESIQIILGTQHGERLMRPTFGSNLKSLVFAPNSPATANLARFYVEDSLKRWEPRIELIDVTVENDTLGNCLSISVTYRLRTTNDSRVFLYTLPLEQRS